MKKILIVILLLFVSGLGGAFEVGEFVRDKRNKNDQVRIVRIVEEESGIVAVVKSVATLRKYERFLFDLAEIPEYVAYKNRNDTPAEVLKLKEKIKYLKNQVINRDNLINELMKTKKFQ